jgi:hypothetical protein
VPLKPCVAELGPGRLCGGLSDRARCPQHRSGPSRRRRPAYNAQERRRRARVVANHIELHGYVCPGCPLSEGRPHQADPDSNPLTADHYIPVGQGGPEEGPLRVMCRRGNSARGARGEAA